MYDTLLDEMHDDAISHSDVSEELEDKPIDEEESDEEIVSDDDDS